MVFLGRGLALLFARIFYLFWPGLSAFFTFLVCFLGCSSSSLLSLLSRNFRLGPALATGESNMFSWWRCVDRRVSLASSMAKGSPEADLRSMLYVLASIRDDRKRRATSSGASPWATSLNDLDTESVKIYIGYTMIQNWTDWRNQSIVHVAEGLNAH